MRRYYSRRTICLLPAALLAAMTSLTAVVPAVANPAEPRPPLDIEVTEVFPFRLTVSWTAVEVPDADTTVTYFLERVPFEGPADRVFAFETGGSLSVVPEIPQSFVVRTHFFNANTNPTNRLSPPSKIITVTPPGPPVIEVLGGQLDGHDVTLSWIAPDIGTGAAMPIKIFQNGVVTYSVPGTSPGTVTHRTIFGLPGGETHRFTVTYTDGFGETLAPPSEPIDVAVSPSDDITPPSPPTKFQLTHTGAGDLLLTWDLATDDTTPQAEIRYEIQRPGSTLISQVAAPPLFYPHPNSPAGLVMRAVDAAGNRSAFVPIVE
ncbi:MAG: hypothetical protein ACRD2X_24405 [Vicinamibacteraceae bacterium]